jgi:hypothetical protein
MPSSHKLLLLNSNRPQEQGFILAVVVIVGLILAAGAMASRPDPHRACWAPFASSRAERLARSLKREPIGWWNGSTANMPTC